MLDGLKVGNEALKKANEMFSIGEIEQIMDDTSEAVEKQNEISAILSGMMISRLFGIFYIFCVISRNFCQFFFALSVISRNFYFSNFSIFRTTKSGGRRRCFERA